MPIESLRGLFHNGRMRPRIIQLVLAVRSKEKERLSIFPATPGGRKIHYT